MTQFPKGQEGRQLSQYGFLKGPPASSLLPLIFPNSMGSLFSQKYLHLILHQCIHAADLVGISLQPYNVTFETDLDSLDFPFITMITYDPPNGAQLSNPSLRSLAVTREYLLLPRPAHGTLRVHCLPTHEKGQLGVFSDTEERMQPSL